MKLTPDQLRYARETLAYRAPEIITPEEREILRAAFPSAVQEPEVETLEVRTEITGPLRELMGAVRGAAAELDGTNDAVAAELLTALARFCAQTGVKP